MNQQPKALISARAKKFIPSQQFVKKRWPRVTKPIMVGKTPCKLLCVFEVKVSNKLLARYKLLGPS